MSLLTKRVSVHNYHKKPAQSYQYSPYPSKESPPNPNSRYEVIFPSVLSKFSKSHYLRTYIEQGIQGIRRKLTSKKVTDGCSLWIIQAIRAIVPDVPYEACCNILSTKSRRMWTAEWPIYPSYSAVGVEGGVKYVEVSRNVVLVRVAWRVAILSEKVIVLEVWYDLNGQTTVELEPLWPFPPLVNPNAGCHPSAISTTAIARGIIIWLHKTVSWLSEVFVHCFEVIHRDAAFRKKHKSLIGEIKQCIGQKPFLCSCQRYWTPWNFLTRDLPPIENRIRGNVEYKPWWSMNIDWKQPIMTSKKPLPQWQEWQWTPC